MTKRSVLVLWVLGSLCACGGEADPPRTREGIPVVDVEVEEAPDLGPARTWNRETLRYGEIAVPSMDASNRITILVAVSNVRGSARSQVDLEGRAIRIAYEPSEVSPDDVVRALGTRGVAASVRARDAQLPDDFRDAP